MKNKIIGVQLFIFTLCINWIQGQNVVNFTSDEGFTNGALYNQTGWDSNYQTTTWNVDANQGLVSTSDEWKRAAWGQEFALSRAGDQITFRVDLNFTGNLTAQNNPMINIGFSSSSAVSTSNPPSNTVFLSTTNDSEDTPGGALQLRNNTNNAPLSLETVLPISDCQGSNGTTDDLAVLVTFTLGTAADTSTLSAKLLNVTDGTASSIGSYTGVSAAIYAAATSKIYGFFHAQSFKSGNSISAINVKKVSMTTNVDVFPNIKRMIGDISKLDRTKYFNIHDCK